MKKRLKWLVAFWRFWRLRKLARLITVSEYDRAPWFMKDGRPIAYGVCVHLPDGGRLLWFRPCLGRTHSRILAKRGGIYCADYMSIRLNVAKRLERQRKEGA